MLRHRTDKKIKLILVYPMTTGRISMKCRVIDSLQLTAKHQVATPVNWLPGEDVIIAGSVSDEEAAVSARLEAPSHIFESSRSRNGFGRRPRGCAPRKAFGEAGAARFQTRWARWLRKTMFPPKLSAENSPGPGENNFATQHTVLDDLPQRVRLSKASTDTAKTRRDQCPALVSSSEGTPLSSAARSGKLGSHHVCPG
jgi:hypothetical protein